MLVSPCKPYCAYIIYTLYYYYVMTDEQYSFNSVCDAVLFSKARIDEEIMYSSKCDALRVFTVPTLVHRYRRAFCS